MAGLDGSDTSSTVYIDDLNPLNPVVGDPKSQGDDHIRFIKKVLKNTFPNIDGPVTATQTELNKTDGVTVTSAEINMLAGIGTTAVATQLAAKQATITGAATTIDTEDLTASRALVSDASGKVGVSSVTSTELGTLSGIGSTAISTQLAAKQVTITGAATTIDTENLTASRALVSDGSGKVGVSTVTSTELALLSGATSLGGTTQGTKATPTSVTNFSFTGIPSGTKRISIGLYSLGTNGTDNIMLQLGDSGGAEDSGYYSSCWQLETGSTLTEYEDYAGFMLGSVGAGLYGVITLMSLDSTGTIWALSGTTRTTENAFVIAGGKTLSSALTQLKIYTEDGAGLFDSGSVNIVYD
jgi:hypothetical protein